MCQPAMGAGLLKCSWLLWGAGLPGTLPRSAGACNGVQACQQYCPCIC